MTLQRAAGGAVGVILIAYVIHDRYAEGMWPFRRRSR
jgi:hypothetical protein